MHLSAVRSESAAGSSGRYDIVLQHRRNVEDLFGKATIVGEVEGAENRKNTKRTEVVRTIFVVSLSLFSLFSSPRISPLLAAHARMLLTVAKLSFSIRMTIRSTRPFIIDILWNY